METGFSADAQQAMNAAGERHEDAEQFRKEIARLKAEKLCPKCGCKMGLWCEKDVKERMDIKNRELQDELAEAKKKPEPGEFTKEVRKWAATSAFRESQPYRALLEACDIIDRLTAKLKAKDEALLKYGNHYDDCETLFGDYSCRKKCVCECGWSEIEHALKG